MTTTKRFRKRPFFSDKGLEINNIILNGKEELITGSLTRVSFFSTYFINITSTLDTYKIEEKFNFKEVLSNEVKKVIKSLNEKKQPSVFI